MKTRFLLLPLLLLAATVPSRAALIYSGVQNVPIPVNPPAVGLEGVYLNIATGATTGAFPLDWSTAPWINPFFGGVNIANSALLRPIITGTDQILNLALGTTIDGTSNFVAGESGSAAHIGPAANQFQLGIPGLIGLTFQTTVGGPSFYGWIRLAANNTGPGTIVDWAYESTPGTAVRAGVAAAVPEPGSALAGMVVGLVALTRRNRPRV